MDYKKECRKHLYWLIFINFAFTIYYIGIRKSPYRTESKLIINIQNCVFWGLVVFFDIHSLILAYFKGKGYTKDELKGLQKRWYMKIITIILMILAGIAVVTTIFF